MAFALKIPFVWGNNGQKLTPQQAAAMQQTAQALAQRSSAPKDVGEGLNAIGQALLAKSYMDRAQAAQTEGQRAVADALTTAQKGTDPNAYLNVLDNPWASQGQQAVAKALYEKAQPDWQGVNLPNGGAGRYDANSANPTVQTLVPGQASQWQTMNGADEWANNLPVTVPVQRNTQTGEIKAIPGMSQAAGVPAAIQEYQYAVGQGYKGNFADYQTEMRKAGATSIDFNQNQGIAAGFADRMANSDKILNDPKIVGAMTDPTNGFKAGVPGAGNYMVGPEYQMGEQAKRDFVNAILRRESGAAISPSEFDNANRQYFPQPGDSQEVIDQKARNRMIALEGVQRSAGPNHQGPDLAPAPPKAGDIVDGYRFNGGDPSDQKSWSKQ